MSTTEDAGDYGGTCDTCANGVAKAGHTQCSYCERQAAEVDEHIDAVALAVKVLDAAGAAMTPAERQVERDERAAILEYDGGLSRAEADRLALEMVPDALEEQP